MKTNITTFALMAIITSSAFAALKAPMPEFKNEKQLAEWRAGKASQATSQGYAKEEPAFYTGRPYLASSGNYAFKYRSYDPEIARWTSEDPSGFPDGANNLKYGNTPTAQIDYQGLQIYPINVTGQNFNFGEIASKLADLLKPYAFQIDVPGTVVKNSTQDPTTVAYNISGKFDADAKFLDFGVGGSTTAGITITGTVRKDWSIKLISHWEASMLNAVGVLTFKNWEVKTFE